MNWRPMRPWWIPGRRCRAPTCGRDAHDTALSWSPTALPGVGFWQSMRNDYSRILEQGRQARAQVRAPHLRASEWLPKEGSSAECAICLANLEVGALVSSLPCSHLFHFECIARWMLQGASMRCSGSCPLCRQQVEESSA
ncbi:NEP1-interacting protein-like 1 (RING-H2 finger protein ATL27) [Durusdinium trenchii]|uniref:RING-type E3 ubiquitin transferase n=1 Tax=Durusdinium trenchii TaxID=1381693 RepID=A0ABP0H858_9DINO